MENKIHEAANWLIANKQAVGLIAVALTGAIFTVGKTISALRNQNRPPSGRDSNAQVRSALDQTTRILEENQKHLLSKKNRNRNN